MEEVVESLLGKCSAWAKEAKNSAFFSDAHSLIFLNSLSLDLQTS